MQLHGLVSAYCIQYFCLNCPQFSGCHGPVPGVKGHVYTCGISRVFQMNNLTLHLQELEEQQQTKPRVSRGKKIIVIRAELNDTETKRTIQRISESRSWFLEKINKIDNF